VKSEIQLEKEFDFQTRQCAAPTDSTELNRNETKRGGVTDAGLKDDVAVDGDDVVVEVDDEWEG
jgi:hypothetical protein